MKISRVFFAFSVTLLLLNNSFCEISSISESVLKVLELTDKPTDLVFMICNQTVEMDLLRNLTSEGSYFGGRFEPMIELGAQETTFIILDVKCPSSDIIRAFHASHFNLIYSRWMLIDSAHFLGAIDEQILPPLLVDTPITQSTELFYYKELPNELLLKQAFKKMKVDNSTVILENYGIITADDTFHNLRTNNVTTIRRKDLQGATFELSIAIQDPDSVNHLNDFVNVEIDTVTKNGLKYALVILESMNGKPELVIARGWGHANPTSNNWTGMLGDLWAAKAEFAGTPSLVRESRMEAVDYLSYSCETWTRIAFRAPKLSYTTNVFLLPFERTVWQSALLLTVIIGGFLLVSTWNEWNVLVPAKALEPTREMLAPQISDVLFLIVGNVCVQGSPATPRSTPGRIIIIFSLIFIVFLYVSYCAFIVALLQSPASNIKTVTDLLNSYIPVGNHDTDYLRFWMKRLTDPAEKLLYEKRMLNKDGSENFYRLEDGIKKMQKGLFAFNMETPIGYRLVLKFFTEHEKCDLREIPFADIKIPYFTSRKHSPFKEILRVLTLRIKENGVQKKLWAEAYVDKPKCTQQGNFMPLALMDVKPVIYIFLSGNALAICVFLMELAVHRYADKIRLKC